MEEAHRLTETIERDAWLDVFDAAPDEVREGLGLSSARMSSIGLIACRALPITELNRALAIGIEEAPTDEDLDAVVDWLDRHAASWALQIAPGVDDPTVRGYIDRASLVETGAGWAKFIGSGPMLPAEPLREAVEVEVVDRDRAALFGQTVTDGFGLPAACSPWWAALVARPGWQCFVAMLDGEVAGAGAMFTHGDAAWAGIEGTLPAFRGRGAQRSIVAAQVRAARAAGVKVLSCDTARPANREDAGFSSYRNQERAGLRHAYTRPNFKRAVQSAPR